jgi:hypothetical protein
MAHGIFTVVAIIAVTAAVNVSLYKIWRFRNPDRKGILQFWNDLGSFRDKLMLPLMALHWLVYLLIIGALA